MAETFGKVSAAIPGVAFVGVRLKTLVVEEEQLPAGLQWSQTERKRQFVRRRLLGYWVSSHQVGVKIVQVLIGHLGEMGVGERGEKVNAFPADALTHRPYKGFL